MKSIRPLVPELQREKQWYLLWPLCVWILNYRKPGETPYQLIPLPMLKWMFTNQSYYNAGNLETVHFLTKLNILLKTFCLFFLDVCILKVKKLNDVRFHRSYHMITFKAVGLGASHNSRIPSHKR